MKLETALPEICTSLVVALPHSIKGPEHFIACGIAQFVVYTVSTIVWFDLIPALSNTSASKVACEDWVYIDDAVPTR